MARGNANLSSGRAARILTSRRFAFPCTRGYRPLQGQPCGAEEKDADDDDAADADDDDAAADDDDDHDDDDDDHNADGADDADDDNDDADDADDVKKFVSLLEDRARSFDI